MIKLFKKKENKEITELKQQVKELQELFYKVFDVTKKNSEDIQIINAKVMDMPLHVLLENNQVKKKTEEEELNDISKLIDSLYEQ